MTIDKDFLLAKNMLRSTIKSKCVLGKNAIINYKDRVESFVNLYGEERLLEVVDNKTELLQMCKITNFKLNIPIDNNTVFGIAFINKQKKEDGEVIDYSDTDLTYCAVRKYSALYIRAKSKNIEFDLTIPVIKKMLKRKRCQMSGCVISNNFPEGNRNKLTFDRLDSTKGYTKDNVVIVAHWVNQLKCDMFERNDAAFDFNKKDIKKLLKVFSYLHDNLK